MKPHEFITFVVTLTTGDSKNVQATYWAIKDGMAEFFRVTKPPGPCDNYMHQVKSNLIYAINTQYVLTISIKDWDKAS